MNPISLCYHDVLVPGVEQESGFPGADAGTYKLDLCQFRDHLAQLPAVADSKWNSVFDQHLPLLTFDDGGSCSLRIAEELERVERRGIFFVTTGLVGRTGFVTEADVRELHARGHMIGSHSCSHRGRMSEMEPERIRQEWQMSMDKLASITGSAIRLASVPSGYYAPKVATEAANSGITHLFTQQPTINIRVVDGCSVIGRYTVRRWTPSESIRSLANGESHARVQQRIQWETRAVAKNLLGRRYTSLRGWYFRATHSWRQDSHPQAQPAGVNGGGHDASR
ncbi:MAG: polysaccharide deacetylase family protein [Bryobacteraceae bacterium]